jgi:zinc transport system ATP-binding protein
MLSGGEQQRVMIAKALVSNPDLLILDEPTSGIDSQAERKFIDLLHKLNKEHNKTIIMVSHDIFALSACNRIYEISDKTIKERVRNVSV